jgi:membrane-associated phospholipid phosphatase
VTVADAVRRRLDPAEHYGLRLTLFGLAFLLVAVPFAFLVWQVRSGGAVLDVDMTIAEDLHDWARASPGWVSILEVVTFFGAARWFWPLLAVLAVLLARRGARRPAIYLAATAASAGLLNATMKTIIGRARPLFEDPVAVGGGKSFPSGHAMASTVVYGALLLVVLPALPRRWRPAAVVFTVALVLAIGFTRLALGVHYLSDVVAGHVLGLAWLAAATAAFSPLGNPVSGAWRNRSSRRRRGAPGPAGGHRPFLRGRPGRARSRP